MPELTLEEKDGYADAVALTNQPRSPLQLPQLTSTLTAALDTSLLGTSSAPTALSSTILSSYHSLALPFSAVCESLSQRLRYVLSDTRARDERKIDVAAKLLLELCNASPHPLLLDLAHQLLTAVFVNKQTPSNDRTTALSTRAHQRQTYVELVSALSNEHTVLSLKLSRLTSQVDYYDRNRGGHRDALLVAIKHWQKHIVNHTFRQWRQNTTVILIQRTRLHDYFKGFRQRAALHKIKYFFYKWNIRKYASHRQHLWPKISAQRSEHETLTTSIDETKQWIAAAQIKLNGLCQQIVETNQQSERLTATVTDLQNQIQTFVQFRLVDTAYYVLELCREMMISLTDECEFAQSAYMYDPFRMLIDSAAEPNKNQTQTQAHAESDVGGHKKSDSTDSTDSAGELPSDSHSHLDYNALEARLNGMNECDVLLLWMNHHIHQANRERTLHSSAASSSVSVQPTVENFTTDLNNSIAYLKCISQITTSQECRHLCFDALDEIDGDSRSRLLVAILHEYDADSGSVLSAEHIVHGTHPDLAAVFISKIMTRHFAIQTDHAALNEVMSELAVMKNEWELMTTKVHKLKQAFAAREASFLAQRERLIQNQQTHNEESDELLDPLTATTSQESTQRQLLSRMLTVKRPQRSRLRVRCLLLRRP